MDGSRWKQVKDVGSIVSILRSYAWVLGLASAAVAWAIEKNLGADRITELGAVLLLCGMGIVALIKQYRPRIDVELLPTTGPSPFRLLRVTNRGSAREFSATCQVLTTRNTKEPFVNQTIDLRWERSTARSLRIESGDTASLIVAMLQEGHPDGGYRILIEAWNEQGNSYPRYFWAWNAYSDETPEADLLIVISGAGAKETCRATFRLSIEGWPEISRATSLLLTEIKPPVWLIT